MSRNSSNTHMHSGPGLGSADVFYSRKGVFVVANHQDIEGLFARGSPMELLPLDCSPERLGEAVLRSLRGSRRGLTKEQARAESAEALKVSGEKNWSSFEKRWQLIVASFEPDEQSVMIAPTRRYEAGGYVGDAEDPTYTCRARATELGDTILTIIRAGPPPVVPYVPSHT